MSGALGVVAAPCVERVSQTLQDLAPGYGSTTVSVSLRGNTTYFLRHRPDISELLLQLSSLGSSQSFFKRIRVESATPGAFEVYNSADATYSLIGGTTGQWVWSVATLWSAADIGEVKLTEIHF